MICHLQKYHEKEDPINNSALKVYLKLTLLHNKMELIDNFLKMKILKGHNNADIFKNMIKMHIKLVVFSKV